MSLKIRFSRRAARELDAIATYFEPINKAAGYKIVLSILDGVKVLERNPLIGRAQTIGHVRRIVIPQSGYLVYYAFEPLSDWVEILTIVHPSRERPFDDR